MSENKKENFNDVLSRELEKFKANIKTIVKEDAEFYERARRENVKSATELVSVPPLTGEIDE